MAEVDATWGGREQTRNDEKPRRCARAAARQRCAAEVTAASGADVAGVRATPSHMPFSPSMTICRFPVECIDRSVPGLPNRLVKPFKPSVSPTTACCWRSRVRGTWPV